MDRHNRVVTLPWLRQGTDLLTGTVAGLSDEALQQPSALPGWSRAHVIGHLARNAEALGRLVHWATTGIETPMYTDLDQRAADIDSSAKLAPARLRHELTTTATGLADSLARLDEASWQAQVRSALGREIPATEIPWMRVREVWLHAVDLNAGVQVDELPPQLIDALLDDASAVVGAKHGCPTVELRATDRERVWLLGAGTAVRVSGIAADLTGWLTGRSAAAGLTADLGLPVLPAWL